MVSLFWRVCFNFIYKMLIFPMAIHKVSQRDPRQLFFSSRKSMFSLAGLFILIGLIADETVLPRFGNIKSTLQGSIFMSGTTWLSQFLFRGNRTTWKGALLLGGVLGLCELPMHAWLLKKRKL